MNLPKDMQRERLYKAERVLQPWLGHYETIEEMQAYVDHLTTSAWFRRRWGGTFIKVRYNHRAKRARAYGLQRLIEFPSGRWAWHEAMLLHEVAHIVTDMTYGYGKVQAHGREYAAIYVELVAHKMGAESVARLKAAFIEHKVKFTKPRAKRVLTEEQKQVLRDRLAAARTAKGDGSVIVWVLLWAALFVGTTDSKSMFDEPVSWGRIVMCSLLIVCAVIIYLVRGDDE